MQTERRKALGAWYTPDPLVDLVVDAALGPLLSAMTPSQFAALRVLDPACGDGAFLRGVLRFCARHGCTQPPGLQGVDVDPAAVTAAQASLQGAARIRQGDWLADVAPGQPWDVIVGNPPWVSVKAIAKDARRDLAARFAVAVGQFDLMALFVERALSSLTPAGRATLLLPDRWLLNPEGEPLRRLVLARGGLTDVVRLGEGRFAGVAMPALLATFEPSRTAAVTRVRDDPKTSSRTFTIDRFSAWDQARLPLHLTEDEVERAEALTSAGQRLGGLVGHGRGVEIGRRSPHLRAKAAPGFAPILMGEDVDRYRIGPGRFLRLGLTSVKYKFASLYAPPKLLLRKTGVGIRAALDQTERLVSQVVYVLRPRAAEAHWLLGVLNSSTLAFLHRARNGEADKRSFPHLRQGDVLALAVPGPRSPARAEIAALAAERMSDPGPLFERSLDQRIDALVQSAYTG